MSIYSYQGRWPSLGARVFLAPGAHLVGDVTLGDDVSFWFHTAARGDVNFIGIGARALDGAVVERGAPIGAGAVVAPGHRITAGQLALGIPARVVRPLTE